MFFILQSFCGLCPASSAKAVFRESLVNCDTVRVKAWLLGLRETERGHFYWDAAWLGNYTRHGPCNKRPEGRSRSRIAAIDAVPLLSQGFGCVQILPERAPPSQRE
jgi:hypothetical protein